MGLIDNDGERMVPQTHAGTLTYAEHVTRYLAAAPLVAGRRVLDIASGSGYGTHLLSQSAAHVTGVDVSATAAAYAQETYGTDNNEFRVGDATAIPLPDDAVDVVVSFETIEHLDDYAAFVAEVDRVLVPDGLFVLSTPNDTDAPQGNPFHTHQFVHDELVGLVQPRFAYVEPYFQAVWKAVVLAPASTLDAEGPFEAGLLNLCPLAPEQYLFFYLLCARRPVTETVEPLLALGEHHSYRLMQEQYLAQATALNHAATVAADAVNEVNTLRRRLATAPPPRPRTKARRR
ncbi:MAG: class I SAM-dependent methyltransferase [Micrococcales bacterium]|nr:class I SAM-dependent methyltransferase [Micrococcales bacterium]